MSGGLGNGVLTEPGRSIRLIFSIADIQAEQEAEFEEGEEGVEEGAEDSEAPLHSYPIRCSFSFTKVRAPPSSPVARHVCLCLVHL